MFFANPYTFPRISKTRAVSAIHGAHHVTFVSIISILATRKAVPRGGIANPSVVVYSQAISTALKLT